MITHDVKYVLGELSNELINEIIADADEKGLEERVVLMDALCYVLTQDYRHVVIERLQKQKVFTPLRNRNFNREFQQCISIIRERLLDHFGMEA